MSLLKVYYNKRIESHKSFELHFVDMTMVGIKQKKKKWEKV